MTPLAHPFADTFLLGYVAACSVAASLFFLRFWKSTGDILFLAFAIFFFIQGSSSAITLALPHPNEGALWMTLVRLFSILGIVGAVYWKNSGDR